MLKCRLGLLSLVLGSAVYALTATPLCAQEIEEQKFSIHGYLTQAFAIADKLPIYGITKDGTWDYRVMALQLRYNVSDKGQFVVQIRNRHLGINPVNDVGVELDWAYYRHDFGPAVVRVGRLPHTIGMYNELRLVGTVLPFFRAPGVFYFPGIETFEGVSVSTTHTFGAWSTEGMYYIGGQTVDVPFTTPTGIVRSINRNEPLFGTQQWINTPIQGLRIGGTFSNFESPNFNASDTTRNNIYAASVDGTFENFFLRSEHLWYRVKDAIPGPSYVAQRAFYIQGGVKAINSVWINAQLERAESDFGGFKFRQTNDWALGASYHFTPGSVLKLEGHSVKGYSFDTFVAPGGPEGKTNYGIASFSVSF